MKRNKSQTKRALLASALALLMCMSMFVGATFAWFTDSVTSGNNRIVAGNLDVDLLMDINNTGSYTSIAGGVGDIFTIGATANGTNATLWEPGKTQVAYLAIANTGSLDLKYQVILQVNNVLNDLYEVMQYQIVPDAQTGGVTGWTAAGAHSVVVGAQVVSGDNAGDNAQGVRLDHGDTHYFALVVHMDESAGNKYQNGEVDFDLQVLATQLTSESDSFDNQYDYMSDYPVVSTGTVTMTAAPATSDELTINTTGAITSASVSGQAAADYYGSKATGSSNEVTLNLNVAKTGETTNESVTTVALEIDMSAVITVDGVTTMENVPALTDYVTINYALGTGLSNVTATHKGNPMVNSADISEDAGHGIYSYDSATGILTIKTTSFSPFAVSYEVLNLIPDGGVYYTGVTSTALGVYTGENVQAYIGDGVSVEFPETVNSGDVFVYGDYEYRYQYFYGNMSAFNYCTTATEDGWHQNSEDSRWYARVLDTTKESYGAVLESINGEVINGLTRTFLNCANMTVAPELPDTVYALEQTFFGCTSLTTVPHLPANGTVMSATFKDCTSLITAPVLPDSVESMISTFHNCTALTTAPTIPAGVTNLTLAFYKTAITTAPALPSGVTNIQFLFRDCSGLSSYESSDGRYVLPAGLDNMQGAFYNCSAFSGEIVIDAVPTSANNCFKGCGTDPQHAITLSGTSSLLSTLAAQGGEYITVAP